MDLGLAVERWLALDARPNPGQSPLSANFPHLGLPLIYPGIIIFTRANYFPKAST